MEIEERDEQRIIEAAVELIQAKRRGFDDEIGFAINNLEEALINAGYLH